MKNIIVLVFFVIMLGTSIAIEPVSDTVDVIAGATNDTYSSVVDGSAGASSEYDDDDDDHDEHDDEHEEDDD
jgi:hypothetical protein